VINIAPCTPNTWSHPCLYPHRAQGRSRRGSKIRIPPCFQYTQRTYISAALNAAPKWTPCNSKSNKTSHRLHRPRTARLGRAKQSLSPTAPLESFPNPRQFGPSPWEPPATTPSSSSPASWTKVRARDRYSSLLPSARLVCF
jgi:hypothetical protein